MLDGSSGRNEVTPDGLKILRPVRVCTAGLAGSSNEGMREEMKGYEGVWGALPELEAALDIRAL